MNLNVYKEYRFSHGTLISTHIGDIYQFSISQNDRFYKYINQHIINEKVSASTNIKIDELTLYDLEIPYPTEFDIEETKND